MKRESPTYALSVLFDLASTLAVPRISKHIPKLMWPALNDEELAEIDTLAATISKNRLFECDHERWPFQAGADKVASVVKVIAALQANEDGTDLTICFAREYFLELAFQRFFASAVHEMARKFNDKSKFDSAHFHYRNAYANARSVLAMPLLVELARKTEVVVGQGNFGYKSSRDNPWVYPHLSHYLSAFYYPWIPNVELPKAHADSAIVRATQRSRHVCNELFTLLSEGDALRERLAGQSSLELHQIKSLFESNPDNRISISPFVSTAITRSGLLPFFEKVQKFDPTSPAFEEQVFNDLQVKQEVADYLVVPEGAQRSNYKKFLQICRRNLNVALRRELNEEESGRDFLNFNTEKLGEYLTWRFLEERLRLVTDRLLLHRRFYDPPLTRSRFPSKFENLGLFAVEVPEVQFNLYVEEFNNGKIQSEESGEAIPENQRQKECKVWLKNAHKVHRQNNGDLWEQGRFPYHALFETYLWDEEPEKEFGAFWMALLISHLVPSINPDEEKVKKDRARFRERLKDQWKDQLSQIRPFAPLLAILAQKKRAKKDHPDTYGEDCELWLWLEKKLCKIFTPELGDSWTEITLEQVISTVFDSVTPPWIVPQDETERKIRDVLRLEPSAEVRLTEAAMTPPQNLREQEVNRLLTRLKEAREREERGLLFFSYDAFFGINTTIFRAFTDLNFARNFVTIRLIATERGSMQAGRSHEHQDHADFVGTYTVWRKGKSTKPLVGQSESYKPRHDAWLEEQPTATSETGELTRNWLSELHSLKLLIKNLGVSLLNQERIKEQERLNTLLRSETARSTIAGIMARNMSHNIGSHVLASAGLLEGVHLEEIQKLHNFLQQRMDFIAQVVTYTPSWGEPMFFFKDLLGGFFDQYLLLTNLIKDQGYPDITFFIRKDDRDREFVFERECRCVDCGKELTTQSHPCNCKGAVEEGQTRRRLTGSWQLKYDGADVPYLPEFLVAIPGGAIGAHAFYVILENILRNSAKYGEQKREGLEVYIRIETEDEFYRIKIWDNTGKQEGHKPEERDNCDCRVCVVQMRLQDELIDPETGIVSEKSRGIHEMKECAGILISPHQEAFGKPVGGRAFPLWADSEDHNGDKYLSYSLSLQKPRLVGIVDSAAESFPKAKSAGVFQYTDIESLSRNPHQLGLIYLRPDSRDRLLKFIEDHHYLLPYRLLVVDRSEREKPKLELHPRRLQWCEIETPEKNEESIWTDFVITLWETWIRGFKGPAEGKWHLLISFDRPAEHSAFVRWTRVLKKFKSDLVDVYLARSKNRSFDAVVFPKGTSRDDLQEEIAKAPSSWAVFDNHGGGISYSEGPKLKYLARKKELSAYQDFSGSKSIRLYQTLESPPASEAGFALFVLGLLESSLINVVIVDERVADAAYDKEKRFKKGLMSELLNARCFPVFSLRTEEKGKPDPVRKFVSETITYRSYEAHSQGLEYIHGEEGMYLTDKEPKILIHVPTDYGSVIQQLKPDQVDTIVIHQGVIDVLERNNQWLGENHDDHHLKILHQLSPSIMITSGRGRTIRHIENKEIPFVEFSIVKDSTYAGLSKYHLVRSILSVAGEYHE